MSWMRTLANAYDDTRTLHPKAQLMLVLDIDGVMQSDHRSFPGVLPMIRWFQLQPSTSIGLLTDRPETVRRPTLESLNRVGALHGVAFDDRLLLMNPHGKEANVAGVGPEHLETFRSMGYHVFAVIDSEPHILEGLALTETSGAVALLYTDTIPDTSEPSVSSTNVRGTTFALTELVPNRGSLPQGVDLVWHGVNDRINLQRFLASGVQWAELDIRDDPSGQLILRHDSFESTPSLPKEDWLTYDEAVAELTDSASGIKLDIKGGAEVVDRVLQSASGSGLTDDRLWFNGDIDRIRESGFRRIRSTHPGAVVQCPIGWLLPLILAAPDDARRVLDLLIDWGIDRFSVNWQLGEARELIQRLRGWGLGVNIYGVRDLEEFLQAVMLLPRSVTADFNFPEWGLFGRGSGEGGVRITYASDQTSDRL